MSFFYYVHHWTNKHVRAEVESIHSTSHFERKITPEFLYPRFFFCFFSFIQGHWTWKLIKRRLWHELTKKILSWAPSVFFSRKQWNVSGSAIGRRSKPHVQRCEKKTGTIRLHRSPILRVYQNWKTCMKCLWNQARCCTRF